MNSFIFLFQHKDYAWLFLSETINAIGAVFTSVLIYHTFELLDASDWWFTLVYLGMFVPSYFGSLLAKRFGQYFHLGRAMLLANVLCLGSLAITAYGYVTQNFSLMLASEVCLTLTGGFIAPFFAFYHSNRFANDDAVAAVVKLDMIQFGMVSVIGFAIGAWLISRVSASWFLSVDALTFLLSFMIVWWLVRRQARLLTVLPTFAQPVAMRELTQHEQTLFWLMPILTVIGIPIMSIGPIFSQHVVRTSFTHNVGVSSILLFLLCRALGQFVGPIVADRVNLERLAQTRWLMPVCLAVFIGCYGVIANTSSLNVMLALVIVAHVFSNIVSMTASYALLTKFENVESVTVKQQQYGIALGFCSAVITTGLLSYVGTTAVFVYLAIVWLIGSVLFLRR